MKHVCPAGVEIAAGEGHFSFCAYGWGQNSYQHAWHLFHRHWLFMLALWDDIAIEEARRDR